MTSSTLELERPLHKGVVKESAQGGCAPGNFEGHRAAAEEEPGGDKAAALGCSEKLAGLLAGADDADACPKGLPLRGPRAVRLWVPAAAFGDKILGTAVDFQGGTITRGLLRKADDREGGAEGVLPWDVRGVPEDYAMKQLVAEFCDAGFQKDAGVGADGAEVVERPPVFELVGAGAEKEACADWAAADAKKKRKRKETTKDVKIEAEATPKAPRRAKAPAKTHRMWAPPEKVLAAKAPAKTHHMRAPPPEKASVGKAAAALRHTSSVRAAQRVARQLKRWSLEESALGEMLPSPLATLEQWALGPKARMGVDTPPPSLMGEAICELGEYSIWLPAGEDSYRLRELERQFVLDHGRMIHQHHKHNGAYHSQIRPSSVCGLLGIITDELPGRRAIFDLVQGKMADTQVTLQCVHRAQPSGSGFGCGADTIVGYIHAYIEAPKARCCKKGPKQLPKAKDWVIDIAHLKVESAHQRRGVGSLLMAGLCRYIQRRRDWLALRTIRLSVLRQNAAGRGLYSRLGFEEQAGWRRRRAAREYVCVPPKHGGAGLQVTWVPMEQTLPAQGGLEAFLRRCRAVAASSSVASSSAASANQAAKAAVALQPPTQLGAIGLCTQDAAPPAGDGDAPPEHDHDELPLKPAPGGGVVKRARLLY